jgi:hypothetical protein
MIKAIAMPLEEEMHHELDRLEKEIAILDEEIEKLYTKVVNLINIRKKKEHDLKILKENFGIVTENRDREFQTTLERLLKESA